jgi:excisionase family DNA binding protein
MTPAAVLPRIAAGENAELELRAFARVLECHQPTLVGEGGDRILLPEPLHRVLVQALRFLERGEGVMILPSTQELTTQSAAELLGVSRQYVVQLVEEGKIPFHKVGSHRRLSMKDVLRYRRQRDANRKKRLGEIDRDTVQDGTTT